MKTKIFIYDNWKQPLEEFEQIVNDFMATVQVIDVKHSTTISDTWITFTMVVLYKVAMKETKQHDVKNSFK